MLLVTSSNRNLIDAPHDGLLISWSCCSRSSGGGRGRRGRRGGAESGGDGGGGGEAGLSQEVMEEERKHFKKIANSFLYYKLVGTVDTAVSDRAETKGGLYCAICYKLRLEERV